MKDIPKTLELALNLAQKQQTVELAQKRLHQSKHHSEVLTLKEEREDTDPPQTTSLYSRSVSRSYIVGNTY